MESSWKNMFYVNLGLKQFKKLEKMCVLGTMYFSTFVRFPFSFFCGNTITYFENHFVEMRIEKKYFFQ